ncbi:MAG: hypothetical protein SGARI_000492 [Bacillariaceae sp.]
MLLPQQDAPHQISHLIQDSIQSGSQGLRRFAKPLDKLLTSSRAVVIDFCQSIDCHKGFPMFDRFLRQEGRGEHAHCRPNGKCHLGGGQNMQRKVREWRIVKVAVYYGIGQQRFNAIPVKQLAAFLAADEFGMEAVAPKGHRK